MPFRKSRVHLLLLSAVTLCPLKAQQRHWRETASETLWTRRYGNCDHGFNVVLPPGVLGHSTKSPSPNHGFMVNLIAPGSDKNTSRQRHRVIWVNEDYVLEPGQDAYTSIRHGGQPPFQTLHKEIRPQRHSTHLGSLKAAFLQQTYTADGKTYIKQTVAALSHNKGIEYTLTLNTTPARAAHDEAIFHQIIAGFHTSPIDNTGKECSND